MTPSASPLQYRRLRAPMDDGSTFFDPPLENCARIVGKNVTLASRRDNLLGGHTIGQLSSDARAHLLRSARAYTSAYRDVAEAADRAESPIILTGHQPELCHPGVWIKNFLLDHLARQQKTHAVHLLIDNDTITAASIRVPTGSVALPRAEAVAFDRQLGEMPFEARSIADSDAFASFATRVSETIKPFIDDPLVNSLWEDAILAAEQTGNLGSCLAQARHRMEEKWGLQTLQVPLSIVCDHAAFRCFTAHILAELPRFQQIYNTSLGAYRRENRIRSQTHPVPALATEGEWFEAPFWLWHETILVRRRMFARIVANTMEITDLHEIRHSLPLSRDTSADKVVDELERLTTEGLRLRPRALLTTMFARLFLSDLFIHGIGGAKYDQLTDAIIEDFFGFEAPVFLTATATAKLPIDRPRVTLEELRDTTRKLRELDFNPQRHIDSSAEAQRLAAAKNDLIANSPEASQRKQRHLKIAQFNNAMQPFVAAQRKTWESERSSILQLLRYEKVLASREYAFCLFPERTLRSFLLDI
ncbi:MAG: hypothetical protein CMJ64_02230 [Planctomycetaceae bacterium]|nr:hypothetical protein [Planctomycetaceae bacterium]